jgi:ribosomal protein L23
MSGLITLHPRISEKVHSLSKSSRIFVFDVPKSVNKHTVAEQIKKQFDVEVQSVRIALIKGKSKRTVAKQGRLIGNGSQSDVKKAYVTLKAGQNLPFFEEIEKEEAKQKESGEKIMKAMETQAKKEEKKSSRSILHRKKESK